MIEIRGLTHSYGRKTVLSNVNLVIEPREKCALVGRNGAGKSTLIHSMLGILPVQQGEVLLRGIPNTKEEWKQYVSYLPEKFSLYAQMSGLENMEFFAELAGVPANSFRIEQCLRRVQLWEDRNEKVRRYSKGMLQRLGLAAMLYFEAEILILDEPTSGLDPMGRKDILSILQSLTDKTILFSSHHMDEIQQICTHVAFLDNGTVHKYSVEEFQSKLPNLTSGIGGGVV